MSDTTGLEAQLQEWKDQLEMINEQLALNPDNAEFLSLKEEVENGIREYEVELAQSQNKTKDPSPPPPPATEAPKWSIENHPAYQGTARKAPQADTPKPPKTYHVNDKVQARYKGKFYNAKVLAVFGSSKDPKFTIKFEGFPETPTLSLADLKPIAAPAHAAQPVKRKAEDIVPPSAPSATHTYSAAPNVNAELASQAKKEPSKVSDGPPRPAKIAKKLKNNKMYEKSANDWKAFNSKMTGKGKMGKKDSMFRTGEGVNARVGFTGSGNAMRSDPKRVKHRYEQVEQEDE